MKSPSSKRKPRRTKGRPEGEISVGRDTLIETAIAVLRETAPEALALTDVAAQAGVHPALIRYYFGNKEGLLKEVVGKLLQREHDAMGRKVDSAAPIEEKLSNRLKGMIDLVQANPHFHRLALKEMYAKADSDGGDDLLSRVTARGLMLTVSMLHDQKEMAIRAVDPRFLHIALIGLSEFYAVAGPLLRELFGKDANLEQLKARYIQFLTSMILHGIAASHESASRVDG